MTKRELWEIYTRGNPKFETQGAFFTARGLRKFFDQTYDAGEAEGRLRERDLLEGDNLSDMLGQIFGGRV